jgi:hypothetical protein
VLVTLPVLVALPMSVLATLPVTLPPPSATRPMPRAPARGGRRSSAAAHGPRTHPSRLCQCATQSAVAVAQPAVAQPAVASQVWLGTANRAFQNPGGA